MYFGPLEGYKPLNIHILFCPPRANFHSRRDDFLPIEKASSSQTLDNSCHLCHFQQVLCPLKAFLYIIQFLS